MFTIIKIFVELTNYLKKLSITNISLQAENIYLMKNQIRQESYFRIN